MGPYMPYGLFQTTGEMCAKFGSDRFRNLDLYKVQTNIHSSLYRVSQEEGTKLREGVPYVKLYQKTPKHLYPKLNSLGDNGN
jgi:hypothetical protein